MEDEKEEVHRSLLGRTGENKSFGRSTPIPEGKNRMGKRGLDKSESGQGQAAKYCERNNEITCFSKIKGFLN